MKKLMLLSLIFAACNNANGSKLDEPKTSKNVARDNAMISYPDAKCDEIGFEAPELHSVRCTLKNGVKLYCTAGITGASCSPIWAPEEVLKAQQAQQQAQQEAQQRAQQTQADAEKTEKTKK